MFGIKDVPLMSHAMLVELTALVDGHVALGTGQVDPGKFTVLFATNGTMGISEALEPRFKL